MINAVEGWFVKTRIQNDTEWHCETVTRWEMFLRQEEVRRGQQDTKPYRAKSPPHPIPFLLCHIGFCQRYKYWTGFEMIPSKIPTFLPLIPKVMAFSIFCLDHFVFTWIDIWSVSLVFPDQDWSLRFGPAMQVWSGLKSTQCCRIEPKIYWSDLLVYPV